MSTRKLLLDARMINSSGIGTYLKNVIPGLRKEVGLALLGNPDELSAYADKEEIINFCAPIYSIREQGIALKSRGADVFWTPHYNVPLLSPGSKKRLVTIHDVFHLAYFNQLTTAQKFYSRLMISAAVSLSDQIITVSQFSKEEIVRHTGCKPDKIKVIYNGVRTEPVLKDPAGIRARYRLPEKYLLFVGNVKPHKNLKKLLEAYLLLAPSVREEFKVVIVGKKEGFITGDSGLISMVSSTPELSGNIHFTGFVADEDMDSIYALASLFVFPSLYEGFGLPPLEAMLNKCPVLSSRAACMPEVCGDAVVYFDPLNAAELSEKIAHTLADGQLRKNLAEKGSMHIRKFRWESSVDEHLRLLRSL